MVHRYAAFELIRSIAVTHLEKIHMIAVCYPGYCHLLTKNPSRLSMVDERGCTHAGI
jgi:hypothetical protein